MKDDIQNTYQYGMNTDQLGITMILAVHTKKKIPAFYHWVKISDGCKKFKGKEIYLGSWF